jgi:chemotaxis protein CheD
MSMLVVGVGDAQVTADPERTLVTYALGSCIAVLIHDPQAHIGGLLHFMLPESSIDPAKAEKNPHMFADTGIPLLFRTAYKLGADKKRLKVGVFGGAQVMDDNSLFNIGKRNHAALRKIFWKAGVLIHKEAVGGTAARTVRLEVNTGKIWLRGPGEPECEA